MVTYKSMEVEVITSDIQRVWLVLLKQKRSRSGLALKSILDFAFSYLKHHLELVIQGFMNKL